MSPSYAFGVAAGLDADVATPLAERCAALGYSSIWSNDHPAASGLETLAAFAEGDDSLELGVAVMALDRHEPAAINAEIERLGLARERLWLGVGAGFSKRPLTRMTSAVNELRDAVPGVRLVLAAMGPKMCALAGASYDGAFFNWMTPQFATGARERVEAGAAEAGRETPRSSATSAPPWAPTPLSASPRRSLSTATCTTATATTSNAWANHWAASGWPRLTATRHRISSVLTRRSTRSWSAGWQAPTWKR